MIPKIIHHMWLDKNISNNENVPKKYDKFMKSFRIHNPDFQVMFWNMERVKKLFDDYPEINKYKDVWYGLPHHIQKCDMMRFIILYLYGGLYIDLDFMCFKNLSPFLNRELFLVLEPPEHSEAYKDPVSARLCNGFIGSVPKHKFWLDWLDFICLSLKKTNDVMYTTGPLNFRIFFNKSKYRDVELINTCDIIPIATGRNGNFITRECIHRNGGSKIIKNDNYYKQFGNYTHTKWSEGSGWGNETLINDTSKNYRLYFLLLVILVLLIILWILSCMFLL